MSTIRRNGFPRQRVQSDGRRDGNGLVGRAAEGSSVYYAEMRYKAELLGLLCDPGRCGEMLWGCTAAGAKILGVKSNQRRQWARRVVPSAPPFACILRSRDA